ncbi:hypothetical protein D9758_005353 [Tetrapyrgos nigripes]|uniref:ATP synthase subunit gamma, mitochondrial n=1 Tax=Tetrapyrgos nigripes TaxID=182062 RepID=A0A8H5GHV6_9AGAR|nr:hypothetical protein D9758_005353 [Tetrapyrgos nigripes]
MFARQTVVRAVARPSLLATPPQARNMATLRELELRLKSVRNIEKITKSMKMIASTKLAKAQRAMQAGKQYGEANAEVFETVKEEATSGGRKLFLVISSDKGLCGGIHSSVTKATRRAIANDKESPLPGTKVEADSPVMVVGDKSKAQLSRALGGNLVLSFNQIGRDVPTFADAAGVADLVIKSGVEYDSVVLVYNKFVSALSYESTAQVIKGENLLKDTEGFKKYEMEDDVTRDLFEFTLANALYAALVEGHACEISARRNAMDNASKNANDMIGTLTMQYNRGRQAAITNELVDIITGASALALEEQQLELKTPITYALLGVSVTLFTAKIIRVRTEQAKLDAIPTIGPQGFFGSYLGAIKYLSNGRDMVEEGYRKYPGGAFKIPLIAGWLVFVNGRDMLEDIKAADDEMSFTDAILENLQTDYTMGKQLRTHPYHVDVVRNALTRNIAARLEDVKQEIVDSFEDELPAKEEWTKVYALPTVMKIVARTTNRLFVGLPLCRVTEWKDMNINFTIKVFLASQIINLFPAFLRPVVGRLLTPLPSTTRMARRYLEPMVKERLAKEEEYGDQDWPGKPNDLLSWLLEEAKLPEQRTAYDLAQRIIAINVAAIHTTSMAFTNTLFHLCARPDIVKELREEVENTVKEYGWTKIAMGKMRKLDSFCKETQRVSGTGAAVVFRKALKYFRFSNGTVLPAGTMVASAGYSMHHDERYYHNASEMDPFRFSDMRGRDGENLKHQMVTPRPEYVLFGGGRHACPGRFFAVNELKLLVSHVLVTFDVAFEPGKDPAPLYEWYADMCVPNRNIIVMFRRRH